MKVYSGNCFLGKCGDPLGVNDECGKPLFVGDIVLTYTDDGHGPTGLTVALFDDYSTDTTGKYWIEEECGPWVMGIKNVKFWDYEPEFEETDSNRWMVKKVKDWSDVIDGEKWSDFGFNYKA